MKVGDLVRNVEGNTTEIEYGIIVDFNVIYDRYGEPREKIVIVNWGDKFPNEKEYMQDLEVVNGNREAITSISK